MIIFIITMIIIIWIMKIMKYNNNNNNIWIMKICYQKNRKGAAAEQKDVKISR